jgi:hypothetical protein
VRQPEPLFKVWPGRFRSRLRSRLAPTICGPRGRMPPVSGVVMAELLGIAAKPHSPAVDTMLGEVIDRVESLKRGIAKFWSENDGWAKARSPTRFIGDSPLEGPGFELSVPRKRDRFLKFAHQMAARKAYAQQSSAITTTTGSSIPPGLNREPATMRPDSAGHCTKKLLEIRTTPSSVPARRS